MGKFTKSEKGWEGFCGGKLQKVYGFLRDSRGLHRVIQTLTEDNRIYYELEIFDAPYDGKIHFHMEPIAEPANNQIRIGS